MTQEEINVLLQPIQQKFIKLEVYDLNNNKLDEIQGNLLGGNLSIDSTVSIRRQLSSLNFVITDSKYIPSYKSYFWINTKIRIAIGFKSIFTNKIVWFHMGWYLFDKPDLKRSQTQLEISISGLDYVGYLNGTRGGYLSNAVKTEIPAATPISQTIRTSLSSLANENNYMVDDIKGSNGVILNTPYVIDMQPINTVYDLISKLGTLYMGWEIFYSLGTETSQPVFTYQSIKDRTNDPISWDFSRYNTIIDIDNQPDFDNVANDIWVWGSSNTQNSPTGLTLTATTGSLIAGTYSYCVTAITSSGESAPCLETSITLSSSGGVNLSWSAISDATSYKIYGRSSGGELYIGTSAVVTFTDNGSITPSGAMPSGQAFAHIQNNDVNSPFSISNLHKAITKSIPENTYTTNDECLSRAENELWLRSYLAESVTITSVPIFPLDVNQVIYINRPDDGLVGKFLVTKISFDLNPTGVMTLNCSRLYKYTSDVTTY